MLAVDADGNAIDGDQIVAILALHFGVDIVAVTAMTNLGFHRLMADRGIRHHDRRRRQALRPRGAEARRRRRLGGEQSGHIIWLRDHVTGDGLVAALLLCRALEGRPLAEAATVMQRYPQALENVRVSETFPRRSSSKSSA